MKNPQTPSADLLTFDDVRQLRCPPPDAVIEYGPASSQFGELFVPARAPARGAVLLIHGGCWRVQYGLDYVRPLAAALREEGIVVWSLEYRRLGEPGGGWPGSFDDVVTGARCLPRIADQHGTDLESLVAVGHSAGGLMALWLAERLRRTGRCPPLTGVVGLSPVTDLETARTETACGDAVEEMFGDPEDHAARYAAASPISTEASTLARHLFHGALDDLVPISQSERFVSKSSGGNVSLVELQGAGHFEPVVPQGDSWDAVRACVRGLLGD